MAFRYRKSFKISKGVRINVGKTGYSVGFGRKGLHHTINSNGQSTNSIGIPNTGISYQTSSNIFKASNSKNNVRSKNHNSNSSNHEIVYRYDTFVNNLKTLHLESDPYIDWEEIANKEQPFELETLGLRYANAIYNFNNYKPKLLENIFSFLKEKKINELQEIINTAKEQDVAEYDKWKKLKELASNVLAGNLDTYLTVIESMKPLNDLMSYGSEFKYNIVNTKKIEVEFKINIDDVIPQKTMSLTPTGRLSSKKFTKTAYYDLCQDYICSCVLRIAEDIFSLLPIELVLINVIDERLDSTTGHSSNIDILSVEINKKVLDSLNKKEIDPSDSMANFRCSMNFLKTQGFKEIERIS